MMTKVLPLLLFLVAISRHAGADTVLIVGDSLSAAYGMSVDQGWVARLQQRLSREPHGHRLVNASISGDTTATARARLPQAIRRHQPDVIILELGGNDGLRGLSLSEMKQNLSAMIETATRQQVRVLLIGVQLPPNYGPRYTQKFHAVYQELAEQYGVALLPSIVDGVGTQEALMQRDGIHPNQQAQALIAERVWEHLYPLLGAAEARH